MESDRLIVAVSPLSSELTAFCNNDIIATLREGRLSVLELKRRRRQGEMELLPAAHTNAPASFHPIGGASREARFMRCKVCRLANPVGMQFCGRCGASLGGQASQFDQREFRGQSRAVHQVAPDRRLVTVLFSDLVGSTQLSEHLDPEELREVLEAYHEACSRAVVPLGGFIAQYLGDGILAYFGYPIASEDHPRQAVSAGLALVDEIKRENTRIEPRWQVELKVRVGIHTGLVVAGDLALGQGRQQISIVGATPNLAARLQGLAQPNTVVISEETQRLVRGYFHNRKLGLHRLKGIAKPKAVFTVSGATGALTRLDVAGSHVSPLVGRDAELAKLPAYWRETVAGRGKVVLISGEAGIGKSRLLHAVIDKLANEKHIQIDMQCSPYHQDTSLYPVILFLQRRFGVKRNELLESRIDRLQVGLASLGVHLQHRELTLLASLLSEEEMTKSAGVVSVSSARRLRSQTLTVLEELLDALTSLEPVILTIEDLHWADPTTLELLSHVMERAPTRRLFVVLTFRPDFKMPEGSWQLASRIELSHLSSEDAISIVEHIAGGRDLPGNIKRQIATYSDGVPLFVEELTRTVIESGAVSSRDDGTKSQVGIPATLQGLFLSRWDRLRHGRELAPLAAVLGHEFTYELLRAVVGDDDGSVRAGLAELVDADVLQVDAGSPEVRYVFKHSLIQEAAYQSLLKRSRQDYHSRTATVLREQFAGTASAEPELLGYHYTEAGRVDLALPCWREAADRSFRRAAFAEAVNYLTRGVRLVTDLPNSEERDQKELDFQMALGQALQASKGYAGEGVDEAFSRARELCRHLNDPKQIVPVLRGQWVLYLLRAQYGTAQELAEQLLILAQTDGDPAHLREAHLALGMILLYLGDFRASRRHLEEAVSLQDSLTFSQQFFPYTGHSGVTSMAYLARVLCPLGYPDLAVDYARRAFSLAEKVSVALSVAQAAGMLASVHQCRRELAGTALFTKRALEEAARHELPYWEAFGAILEGWVDASVISPESGITKILRGLELYRATGSTLGISYFNVLLAEKYLESGSAELGLEAIAVAQAHIDRSGEGYYAAEVQRLKGCLLLLEGKPWAALAAEVCFRESLEIARNQGALTWILRTSTSLASQLRHNNRADEGQRILQEAYGAFEDGLKTADLLDARRLLHELDSRS